MTAKILIAEDKADSRKLFRSVLEVYGYDVIEAENGAEAVEKTLEQKPDIILMDIAMPVMNGIEAVRTIRKQDGHAHLPIICITAYGDQYQDEAQNAGCDHILPKPIDFRQLDPLLDHYAKDR